MSIVLDLILALILAICAFIGYKKGLVHALSKFISYLVSFTLANKLYFLLGKLFIKLPFLEKMAGEEPFAESMTFLDRVKDSFTTIKENFAIFGSDSVMAHAKEICDHATAVIIASTLAFAASFVIILLLMKLLLFVFDEMIQNIPVVGQVNGVLGGIFGLLNGFFWTWLVANTFVQYLLPSLNEKFPNVFVMEFAESVIVQFCTKINPITYLIWLINFIFH